MANLNFEKKLVWVTGLLIRCPMQKPLDNCPLEAFRKLPVEERVELADNMDEAELDQIIKYHDTCLWEREGLMP